MFSSRRRLALAAIACLACIGCLLFALKWWGQDQPLEERINRAIHKGLNRLKSANLASDGRIAFDGSPGQDVGITALVALTCLELGLAGNSSYVTRLADAVREGSLDLHDTYSLSLAIMLFDRLGDPADQLLIEVIGVRLLAGQTSAGVWGYLCPKPDNAEVNALKKRLDQSHEFRQKGQTPKIGSIGNRKTSPEMIVRVQKMVPNREGVWDNSNTHFAMLALWVTRRHGLPVEAALTRAARHFRETQARIDPPAPAGASLADGYCGGTWGYRLGPPSATMTCAGLFGLALGHGLAEKKDKGLRPVREDSNVKAGFQALGAMIKNSETGFDVLLLPRREYIYYFLFTLERTALVYNVGTIGDKDWYAWGAKILVDNQLASGYWEGEPNHGLADTCFALLFLKRANVAHDLILDWTQ